jgi:GntR family transcriptional repressor for pyruvate dehydrogenase complex
LARNRRINLVARTTAVLREQIFAAEPGALIGSLHQLARALEVGIVTLQQAARVLEHEGLLEVRRGPGGGYYGMRPDDAALERALDSYMRMNPASFEEALDMTSLLFNELAPAVARCTDADLQGQLASLLKHIDACETRERLGELEMQFQELLFRMVRQPLFELLTRVTLHYATSGNVSPGRLFGGDTSQWRIGRKRIIQAILANDPELTRLETNRHNRAIVLARLKARDGDADHAPGGTF